MRIFLVALLALACAPAPAYAAAPTGPDIPRGSPRHVAPPARQGGTAALTFSEAERRAKLRMDSGGGLDSLQSGVISVPFDMQGFEPDAPAGRPPVVRMSVFDVDEQGSADPECLPEFDQVTLNGQPIGTLSGNNETSSLNSFGLPPRLLTPGVNSFDVHVDAYHTGCWVVRVDWIEVEFSFNVGHVAVDATDDVDIRRGKGTAVIGDQVFSTSFEPDGRMRRQPAIDDPIADSVNDSRHRGAGSLTYQYYLDAWPARPGWTPSVDAKWEFLLDGRVIMSGAERDVPGWTGVLKIPTPLTTGRMRLRMEFAVFKDGMRLRTDKREHVVYMTLHRPVPSGTGVQTQVPKAFWLDRAFEWGAANRSAEHDLLSALTMGVYERHPATWVYHNTHHQPAVDLLEETATDGQCTTFVDVWDILASSMGIGVGVHQFSYPLTYVTKQRPALDRNANAHITGPGSAKPDRWQFQMHEWGTWGGHRYDPTFGLLGRDSEAEYLNQAVFCKNQVDGDGIRRCHEIADPSRAYRLIYQGRTPGLWPLQRMDPARQAGSPEALGIGSVTDRGDDRDGNGQFDFLRVEVPVDVPAGTYAVEAVLSTSDGLVLGLGALDPEAAGGGAVVELGPGAAPVVLSFSGRQIRDAGVEGPYRVQVRVVAEDGSVAAAGGGSTKAYQMNDFQGILASTGAVTDSMTAHGLRVEVPIVRSGSGEVALRAELEAGGTVLDSVERTVSSTVEIVEFAGDQLWASGFDGLYVVRVQLLDRFGQSTVEHRTAAYRAADFPRPAAFIEPGVTDRGVDLDGDGLFETLQIVALGGGSASNLEGTLATPAGSVIATASAPLTQATTLSFDGTRIARHGADGPFVVRLSVKDNAGNTLMARTHPTGGYAASAFEQPAGVLGVSYSDTEHDGNGDNRPDALRVNVSVRTTEPGAYELSAALFDRDGGFVTAASAVFGDGETSVPLDFSGADIRAHGVDGPFTVSNVTLRHLGSDVDFDLDAHQTAFYPAARFRPGTDLYVERTSDRVADTDGDGLYDRLEVHVVVVVARPGRFAANARLVDPAGEEIGWAELLPDTLDGEQTLVFTFDGRAIHGHGVDGPYRLVDLTVAEVASGSEITAGEGHTTGHYAAAKFEQAGLVIGRVTVEGTPYAGAVVAALGLAFDTTGPDGTFRLGVTDDGDHLVGIAAPPALTPWDIRVNGTLVATGTRITVPVAVGHPVTVDFTSPAGSAGLADTGRSVRWMLPAGLLLVAGGVVLVLTPNIGRWRPAWLRSSRAARRRADPPDRA